MSILFAAIGWFAVIAQYILMIENRITSVGETTIRFFSFFTILTNSLVAIYFSYLALKSKQRHLKLFDNPGSLTAIAVYIAIVGLVYQFVLRQIWEPTGLQMVVDELLHSVAPICVIFFWYLYENKSETHWRNIPSWLIYPLVYLAGVLIRGNVSEFYPYPFINVTELGIQKVIINGFLLLAIFFVLSMIFIGIGKRLDKNRKPASNTIFFL
jgi:hypothetical protein